MSLFDALDGALSKKDIKKRIETLFAEEREKPPPGPETHMRASGIVLTCPRAEALRARHSVTVTEKIAPKTARTFRMGRSWERLFRDEILGKAGIVLGKWGCLRCDHVPAEIKGRPRYAKPDACGACGFEKLEFVEEFALDSEAGVGGHNDGFLLWNGEYAILELKTANAYNFSSLKMAPSANHVGQVQVYMAIHGYQRSLIIYLNKDTSDLCYHWVEFDRDAAQRLLDKGRALKRYFATGRLPERECISHDCQRAMKCPVGKFCFNEDTEVPHGNAKHHASG